MVIGDSNPVAIVALDNCGVSQLVTDRLANRLAKQVPAHAGVFDLGRCDDADNWLETVAIEDVWGIGRKLARWWRLRGITNARQLRDMPSGELRAKCGVVGLRLQRELRGHACLPLDLAPAPKQETCVSRSFSRPSFSRQICCRLHRCP